MNLIKTKSFEIATYQRGNLNAPKLALVLPGRLDTKDYANMRSHVDFLASKGFLSLSFDPPGTWESKGVIGIYNMTNYIKAVDEIITYYGNIPTFVVGHSRGGSIAMFAGLKNEKIIAFASIFSHYSFSQNSVNGFSDEDWKVKGFKISKRDLPNNSADEREFKLPYSFYEDQIRYNALPQLKTCKKPKLFIAGKRDTTVDPELVVEAYNKSLSPKDLEIIDSPHDYRFNQKTVSHVNVLIGKFLDKYSL